MKYTGWAVIIIGLIIGLYAFFTSAPADPALTPPAAETTGSSATLTPVLYVFAGVAFTAGLLMLLVGGRGVIKTKNLAVRR